MMLHPIFQNTNSLASLIGLSVSALTHITPTSSRVSSIDVDKFNIIDMRSSGFMGERDSTESQFCLKLFLRIRC